MYTKIYTKLIAELVINAFSTFCSNIHTLNYTDSPLFHPELSHCPSNHYAELDQRPSLDNKKIRVVFRWLDIFSATDEH